MSNINVNSVAGKTEAEIRAEYLAELEAKSMETAQAALELKYPHIKFVPGTLRMETYGKLVGKRAVDVICPGTGQVVRRATSDLFTFKGSPEYLKILRKGAKGGKGLKLDAELEARLAKLKEWEEEQERLKAEQDALENSEGADEATVTDDTEVVINSDVATADTV